MVEHLRSRFRLLTIAVLTSFSVLVLPQPFVRGESLTEHAHSLRAVPADIAFYSASLRLKEQLDSLLESKAYAKLMEIPLFQLAKMQATFQWQQSSDPRIARVRDYFQSDEGKEALALLKEMFSEEVFVAGGRDITGSLDVLMELNSVQQRARMEAMARGDEASDVITEKVLELLEKHSETFQMPTFVLGFRIRDTDRAHDQLDNIHSLVRNLLDEHQPELSAHLQREEIAGSDFLTLRLDSSMFPWDQVREESDQPDEQIRKWEDALEDKSIAVALGVVEEFVLLSVGSSTRHLQQLGEGPFLIDTPAMKQLEEHAGERVLSISYVSEELTRSLGSPERTIEDLAGTAEEILRQADVPEHEREQIVEDVRSLDLRLYMPEPGYTAEVVFSTARGFESYRYNSGSRPMTDSSKPLTITEHVGGNPTLFVATRAGDTVEDYDRAIDWLRRTAGHIEEAVEVKVEAEDWNEYLMYRERILGLLARLNRANRELLYPAFADNQGAFVLDTAAQSTQWVEQMPEASKPLPMLELGVVTSVSDAEKLREGVREYIAVARDAAELLREIDPEAVPPLEFPQPEKRDVSGGTLRVFVLPEEWGLDEQIAPSAGLSDSAAVLSTMPSTAERLLTSTPLEIDTAIDIERPAAKVLHVEFHELVSAIRPWVDYGFDVAMGKLNTGDDGEDDEPAEQSPVMMQMGFVVPQVHQLLDIVSVFRSSTSITYEQDDLWVTHSETHIEDLK